ncbi:hypothetical protein AVEN_150207-1 [Araneus ventricosus]|uniref:Uncharacterized protein n=1 Tax=Araneus ventricosus TaxID=182803 RepID=A0A4Y2F7D7_ARAVE|nr:hypothetical protein AVEN_126592-1 [Araneus ventricosus]GBM36375.1 hypothetical protein AVEN_150207-1 [Araneus ventricosus]
MTDLAQKLIRTCIPDDKTVYQILSILLFKFLSYSVHMSTDRLVVHKSVSTSGQREFLSSSGSDARLRTQRFQVQTHALPQTNFPQTDFVQNVTETYKLCLKTTYQISSP